MISCPLPSQALPRLICEVLHPTAHYTGTFEPSALDHPDTFSDLSELLGDDPTSPHRSQIEAHSSRLTSIRSRDPSFEPPADADAPSGGGGGGGGLPLTRGAAPAQVAPIGPRPPRGLVATSSSADGDRQPSFAPPSPAPNLRPPPATPDPRARGSFSDWAAGLMRAVGGGGAPALSTPAAASPSSSSFPVGVGLATSDSSGGEALPPLQWRGGDESSAATTPDTPPHEGGHPVEALGGGIPLALARARRETQSPGQLDDRSEML